MIITSTSNLQLVCQFTAAGRFVFLYNSRLVAYFQENDAIATVDIVGGTVKDLKPLPRKNWDGIKIDASDRDGGNGTSGNFGLYF